MDPVLIAAWLDGAPAIPIFDPASVSLVRERVREEAARLGLPAEKAAGLVNVASELGANQLAHARGGRVAVVGIARGGVPGVEIRAIDRGDGIADPATALRPGESTAGTLGIGLCAVLELADEVDFDVRLGEGTCVRARSFAAEVVRSRNVGVFGRPYPGESVAGDGAFVSRGARGLLAIALDGLGHGEEARAATNAAMEAARGALDRDIEAIFAACHLATQNTRGVAMTAAEITEDGELTLAGIGNVMGYVVGPGRASSRFTGAGGVVGAPGPLRRIALERTHLTPYDAVLLFSDGLSARVALEDDLPLLREPPIVIAQRTFERYARDNDDALVVAAR